MLERRIEEGAAMGGDAVFLEAALGFFREGVFDQFAIEHFTDALVQFTGDTFVTDPCGDPGF